MLKDTLSQEFPLLQISHAVFKNHDFFLLKQQSFSLHVSIQKEAPNDVEVLVFNNSDYVDSERYMQRKVESFEDYRTRVSLSIGEIIRDLNMKYNPYLQ